VILQEFAEIKSHRMSRISAIFIQKCLFRIDELVCNGSGGYFGSGGLFCTCVPARSGNVAFKLLRYSTAPKRNTA
jgi:hypothetical protein